MPKLPQRRPLFAGLTPIGHSIVKCLCGSPILPTKWELVFIHFKEHFSGQEKQCNMFTTMASTPSCVFHK